MPLTVSTEYLASNLNKLLNQLEDGTLDSVEIVDGQAVTSTSNSKTFSTPSTPLGKLVTYTAFNTANTNAGGTADVSTDTQSAYQVQSSEYQKTAIYKAVQNLRETEAAGTGNAAAASLTVAGAASPNGDITYTAKAAGPGGNSITVEHVVAGNNTARSIVVTDTAIVVNVATDGGGAVDSTETATAIAAAINADSSASALVSATALGTGAALVDAAAEASLANGSDPLGAAGPNVFAIKRSKNDTDPRAVLMSNEAAIALGL